METQKIEGERVTENIVGGRNTTEKQEREKKSQRENDSNKEEIVEGIVSSNKNQKKDFKNKKSKFKNKKKKRFLYDKKGTSRKTA